MTMQEVFPEQSGIGVLDVEHRRDLLRSFERRLCIVIARERAGEEQHDDPKTRDDGIGNPRSFGQLLCADQPLVESAAA